MADKYDLVVIGSGPGGYVAAIRAAQLGMKVACVEKRKTLGGTCLNIGCIPSKALLQSSHLYHEAQHAFGEHGIKAQKLDVDLAQMLKRKDKVVKANTDGVAFLFKKNKVDWKTGRAKVEGPGKVSVGGKETLEAKNILIATGSESATLSGLDIDEKRILTSTGALELSKVPKSMVVIGAGYIGLEMGSVWARLGTKVTVVEYLDRICPGMDSEIAKQFQRILGRQGLEFRLGSKVTSAEAQKTQVKLTVEPAKGGDAEELKAETVLVAVGRKPHTEGLGLRDVGVELDDRGFIQVDTRYRTNVDGIWAIGDVVPGPMLAHKASEEGIAAVEHMAGKAGHVNYETCPGIVYTWPEVATIGATEDQLKEDGVDYNVGKFPFTANARARCNGDTDGLVKILADKKTDRILGVHILGPEAGDLIHEGVVAMEFGGSAEDLALSFHGHPSLNEAVREAALDVGGRVIHM